MGGTCNLWEVSMICARCMGSKHDLWQVHWR